MYFLLIKNQIKINILIIFKMKCLNIVFIEILKMNYRSDIFNHHGLVKNSRKACQLYDGEIGLLVHTKLVSVTKKKNLKN